MAGILHSGSRMSLVVWFFLCHSECGYQTVVKRHHDLCTNYQEPKNGPKLIDDKAYTAFMADYELLWV